LIGRPVNPGGPTLGIQEKGRQITHSASAGSAAGSNLLVIHDCVGRLISRGDQLAHIDLGNVQFGETCEIFAAEANILQRREGMPVSVRDTFMKSASSASSRS